MNSLREHRFYGVRRMTAWLRTQGYERSKCEASEEAFPASGASGHLSP